MNMQPLENSMIETRRFLRLAEIARRKMIDDNTAYIRGSKETAAAKRSSMDLTRSLAELRKPPHVLTR